uniref:Transcription factor bHLH56 n=1 Tax=Nothapodytes nimmoniana TaxID=159386 RepID=A0A9E9C406_NOTNI|nr:transcription factor bHLH56 [Nothapodytes nimmoniana]
MELHQHSFLEELAVPIGSVDEFLSNDWSLNTDLAASDRPFSGLVLSPTDPPFGCSVNESCTFLDGYALQDIYSSHSRNSNNNNDISTPPFPIQQDYTPMVKDGELIGLLGNNLCGGNFEEIEGNRSHEAQREDPLSVNMPISSNTIAALRGERKNYRVKKFEGRPSKNLMAERRRRKRLNDRLSMLRSIVPKISKMDRTSILGDTIDYMKELLEKINRIQDHQEDLDEGVDQKNLMGHFNELKPNQMLVRNPPKFNVDRRNLDTRIEICCAAKPGLLVSTLNTLEALGLDIKQCVISCFNDFSLQASCSEVVEHRSIISCEDVKQELCRNVGSGR